VNEEVEGARENEQLLSLVPSVLRVENAIVSDERFELGLFVVSLNPVDHEAAV
jgi:hypothetical protein